MAADVRPVIAVETTFTETTIPDDIEVYATLDTLSSGSTWFDTSNLATDDELRFAIQMDASTLETGRYSYQMTIIAHYGTETATRAFSGFVHHVNLGDSTTGDGWNIAVTEQLVSATGRLLHVRGDGTTVWFEDNQDDTYSAAIGPSKYSTLVKNIDNTYTLTDKYGFKTEFDSAGLLTSHVVTVHTPITVSW